MKNQSPIDESAAAIGYGEQFSEIYDEIFPPQTVSDTMIDFLEHISPVAELGVLEMGVGTGRIALPLARKLKEVQNGEAALFVGVDASPKMLAELRKNDVENLIDGREGAAQTYSDTHQYGLVLCVCGTISMLESDDQASAAIRKFAEYLAPGGRLVIETHNPLWVQSYMEGNEVRSSFVPYGPARSGLASFSRLDYPVWSVDHVWINGDSIRPASETSHLFLPSSLDVFAEEAGLTLVQRNSTLEGSEYDENYPLYVNVYERAN